MTNYKVRAAGNDNVVLFQIRGFPTDSLTAGLDVLEKKYLLLGAATWQNEFFISQVETLPPCSCPISDTCCWNWHHSLCDSQLDWHFILRVIDNRLSVECNFNGINGVAGSLGGEERVK